MDTFFTHINWSLLVASGVAIFTVVSYIFSRRRELAWRRTEFLCAQSQYLDNDPVLIEVVMILEDRHVDITVSQIFDDGSKLDEVKQKEYLQKFDKLLNLLWRLCYAYLETKTISRKEIEGFGWYLLCISEYPSMVKYCDENGYEDINIVLNRLKRFWEKEENARAAA
jgi:hypothetical protein